jgi:hypothetical protein
MDVDSSHQINKHGKIRSSGFKLTVGAFLGLDGAAGDLARYPGELALPRAGLRERALAMIGPSRSTDIGAPDEGGGAL